MSSVLFYYLSIARLVTGLSAIAMPEQTSQAFGIQKPANSDATLMIRLFGARDFVLGASLLYAKGNPEAFRYAMQMGLVCDSIDTVSGLVAYKDGTGVKATLLASAGASLFAAIAAYLLSTNYVHDK